MTRNPSRPRQIAAALALLLAAAGASAQTARQPASFKKLADFEHCLEDRYAQEQCLRLLESYAGSHPAEAMPAGRQVRRHFHAHAALPFFEIAQKQKKDGFCADEDVRLAVLSGLSLPADYSNAERARRLFAAPCFGENEAAVLAGLASEQGASYLRDNACPILKQRGRTPASCAAPAPAAAAAPAPEERLPAVDKATLRLGIAKTYRGPEGERVTLAPIEGGDLYLVRFEGIAGSWNGKSILHKREDRGNGKAEFWTEHEGKRWVGIVQRGHMEVYAPGNRPGNGFSVGYSEKATQAVDARAVLDAF